MGGILTIIKVRINFTLPNDFQDIKKNSIFASLFTKY